MRSAALLCFGETPPTVVTRAGDPRFIAKGACDAPGIANSLDVADVLGNDEKADVGLTDTRSNGGDERGGVCLTYTPSNQHGEHQATARDVPIVSDAGFYTLALRRRAVMTPGTTGSDPMLNIDGDEKADVCSTYTSLNGAAQRRTATRHLRVWRLHPGPAPPRRNDTQHHRFRPYIKHRVGGEKR